MREHNEAVNRLDVMVERAPIETEYAPGETVEVTQHDGTVLRLRKLDADYDPRDRAAAIGYLQQQEAKGEVVTGLLYVDPDAADMHDALATIERPLNALDDAALVPGAKALDKLNASLR